MQPAAASPALPFLRRPPPPPPWASLPFMEGLLAERAEEGYIRFLAATLQLAALKPVL